MTVAATAVVCALAVAGALAAPGAVHQGDVSPPGAGPGGALAVSVDGSDTNPCTPAAPCASLDRAYHVAVPGQTVLLAGGTYPPQTIKTDPTKTDATSDVVFASEPGQLAVLGGLLVKQASHITFLGHSVATAQNLAPATEGITLMATPAVADSGAYADVAQCSDAITFRGIDFLELSIENSNDVSVFGGAIGGHDNTSADSTVTPEYYTFNQQVCPDANPTGVLFSGVLFHDVGRELAPLAHPDCLQISGTAGMVVENSTFIRCATSDILGRPADNIWPGAQLTGLVLRNNFFAPITEPPANQILLGAGPDRCGTIDLEYNTSDSDLASYTCGSYTSLTVVGNYQQSISRYACQYVLAKATVYDHNVMGFAGANDASSCGTNSGVVGDPRFADEAAFDYRIERGSPLIGRGGATSHPPVDINGNARPARWEADAGASQWDPATIVLGKSIGLARIGAARSAVEASYGPPRTERAEGPDLRLASYRLHGGLLQITYTRGIVSGLATTSPYYSTPSGVGVGIRMPGWSDLRWAPCIRAYSRNAPGYTVLLTPVAGARGNPIGAIGIFQGPIPVPGARSAGCPLPTTAG